MFDRVLNTPLITLEGKTHHNFYFYKLSQLPRNTIKKYTFLGIINLVRTLAFLKN